MNRGKSDHHSTSDRSLLGAGIDFSNSTTRALRDQSDGHLIRSLTEVHRPGILAFSCCPAGRMVHPVCHLYNAGEGLNTSQETTFDA